MSAKTILLLSAPYHLSNGILERLVIIMKTAKKKRNNTNVYRPKVSEHNFFGAVKMHSIYALSQSTSASPPSFIFHKLKQHVCMHYFEKRSILGLKILSFKLFTTNFTIIYAKTCTIHSFYPSRHSACCSTATDSKHKLMYNRPQFCSRKKEPDMGVDPDGSSPIKKVNEMCDSPY